MRLEPAAGDRQSLIAICLLALVGALALFLVFNRQDTLTIAIHRGVEGVPLTKLAEDFSREKRVAVEVVDLPYDALYGAEMADLETAETRFDVIMLDDPWLPALIGPKGDASRLARLEDTDCRELNIGDFVESTLRVSVHPLDGKARPPGEGHQPRPFTCEDSFYALPFVGNTQLFLTRGQQPATWQDVAAPGSGYVLRAGPGNSIVTDFMPILWSVVDGDTRPAGGAPPELDMLHLEQHTNAIRAFQVLEDLGRRKGAHRSVVSADDFDLTIQLVQRQASMSIAWAAWVMAMARLPEPYRPQKKLENVPANGADPPLQVVDLPGTSHALGAWLLAIPVRAAHRTRAREFLRYALHVDQLRAAARSGNPPPRRSLLQDKDLTKDFPWLPQQLTSLETARPRPRTPQWRDIEAVYGDCLSALYDGAIDAQTAWNRLNIGLEPLRKNSPHAEKFTCVPSRSESAVSTASRIPRRTNGARPQATAGG